MARYLKYVIIWLLLLATIVVSDNYRFAAWEESLAKLSASHKQAIRVIYIDEYSIGEEPTTTTVINDKLAKGEKDWLTNYLSDGSFGLDHKLYQLEYDALSGKAINYRLIKESPGAIPMVPHTYIKGTKVTLGAFFRPRFSRYGVNCHGCSGEKSGHGNFGVGISADVTKGVRQYNGKFKKGITFEGYYIVAADRSIPYCTILEISNHNFKGGGLTPGLPFYAVVLDRGGAIKQTRLDFYIGDERFYNDTVKYSGKRSPQATIVAFGSRRKDEGGRRSCKLPSIESLQEDANN